MPPPPPPPCDFMYIFKAISAADVTADCLSAPGAYSQTTENTPVSKPMS